MKKMGSFPFYIVGYKGKELLKHDATVCKEFEGDCLKLIDKYLKFTWFTINKPMKNDSPKLYENHLCSEDELPESSYNSKWIHLCPPTSELMLENNIIDSPSLS